MIGFACQSGNALVFGLLFQGPPEFPPRVLEVDLLLEEERAAGSMPSMDVLDLPFPFQDVGDCGSHRTPDHIPWTLLGLELIVELSPSLLQMGELFWWPVVIQGVHGFDVVQDDLVSWIHVLLAVEVIRGVQQTSRAMT